MLFSPSFPGFPPFFGIFQSFHPLRPPVPRPGSPVTVAGALDGPKLGLGRGDLYGGGAGLVEEQSALAEVRVLRHGACWKVDEWMEIASSG